MKPAWLYGLESMGNGRYSLGAAGGSISRKALLQMRAGGLEVLDGELTGLLSHKRSRDLPNDVPELIEPIADPVNPVQLAIEEPTVAPGEMSGDNPSGISSSSRYWPTLTSLLEERGVDVANDALWGGLTSKRAISPEERRDILDVANDALLDVPRRVDIAVNEVFGGDPGQTISARVGNPNVGRVGRGFAAGLDAIVPGHTSAANIKNLNRYFKLQLCCHR
jgi:hypothetical protein